MGRRRMSCGSDNKATEHQEENRNGRRHEAYDRPRWLVIALCLSVVLVSPQRSLAEETAQGCNHICWQKVIATDVSFTDGIHLPTMNSEQLCKDVCANNETCVGTYWGFDSNSKSVTCFLQVTTGGGAGGMTGANHSFHSNCTDECLPYCWKEKKVDVKTLGGILHRSVKNENQCKLMCSNDHMCDGVDWKNTLHTCYLLYKHRRTADSVNHWEIVRNLPTNCTKNEEQCMPHCWKKAESPDLTFTDGLLRKGLNNEKDCKDLCSNNQTCTGVYWGFSAETNAEACYLQIPAAGESGSLTKVTHWSLSNCTDDCLPYCWLQKWDHIQTAGGSIRPGITNENQCKVLCAYDKRCLGIDWNVTEHSCWILHELKLITSPSKDPMHHWENERNLPMVCSSEPSLVSTLPPESENANETVLETAGENETVAEGEGVGGGGEGEGEGEGGGGGGETPASEEAAGNETAIAEEGAGNETVEEGGGGGGGPETGESAVAKEKKAEAEEADCPTYMIGIITLAVLMAICVLIIIGLVAYIVSRTRPPDPEVSNKPLTSSQAAFRSYQSIQTISPGTAGAAAGTAGTAWAAPWTAGAAAGPTGSAKGSFAGPAGSAKGSVAGPAGSARGSAAVTPAVSTAGSTAVSPAGSTAGSAAASPAGSTAGSTAGSAAGSTAGSAAGSTAGSVAGSETEVA